MTIPAIDNLPPVHPGEILRDELEALSMSARKFADHIRVPPNAVTAILNGQRGITAQMALRLGQAFGTGPGYWMRLQGMYEVKCARAELAGVLEGIGRLGNRGAENGLCPRLLVQRQLSGAPLQNGQPICGR